MAAPVDTDGLAARAGLRPSTLRRRPHPEGLWNRRSDRLAVGRWDDPYLDTHREQVRYNDYRCSVPARNSLEGATVRWHGHTDQPEADTAPSSVNEPLDGGRLWGGLIDYKSSYTTSACKKSSGAAPFGRRPEETKQPETGSCRTWPTPPTATKVDTGETQLRNHGYFGGLGGTRRRLGGVGSGPTVRLACRGAGRSLEVDRVVRLGRPVQNPRGLATHFARCFARPQLCHQRHQGACGDTRLKQHRGPASTNTSQPEPHTTTTAPPNQYQPRTSLPNPDRRFRSPLQNHGSSITNSSKPPSLAYPHR